MPHLSCNFLIGAPDSMGAARKAASRNRGFTADLKTARSTGANRHYIVHGRALSRRAASSRGPELVSSSSLLDQVDALDKLAGQCARHRRRNGKLEASQLEALEQTLESLAASTDSLDSGSVASIACCCAQILKARAGDRKKQTALLKAVSSRAAILLKSHDLPAGDMVRILWALASCKQLSNDFWVDVEQLLLVSLADGTLNGKDMALVAWSAARAGVGSSEVFRAIDASMGTADEQGGSLEASLSPRDASMLVWAFATQRIQGPNLCKALYPLFNSLASQFYPRDISVIIWGLSSVTPKASKDQVVDAFEQRIIEKRSQFSNKSLGILMLGMGRLQQGSQLLWNELEDEVLERVDQMPPRELGTIVSSFAKMGYGSESLYDHVEYWILKHGQGLKPGEFVSVVWALATMRPGSESLHRVLEGVSPWLISAAETLDAHSCPKFLWACTQAKECPSETICFLLCKSIDLAPSFNLQGVSMTLHAARVLQQSDGGALPDGLLTALEMRVLKLDNLHLLEDQQGIAGTLLGFAHLNHCSQAAVDKLCAAAQTIASKLEARNLSNILWATAELGHASPEFFRSLESAVIARSGDFVPAGLCQCVWAYATTDLQTSALFVALEPEFVKQKDYFSIEELAQAAWAFSKAGEDGHRILESVSYRLSNTKAYQLLLPPSYLAMLSWALARQNELLGSEVLQRSNILVKYLEAHLFNCPSAMGPRELAIVAHSLATVGHDWAPELTIAISCRALELKASLKPQDISNILWSFARSKVCHSELFKVMDTLICQTIETFSCQAVANSIWALGRMGHVPSDAFLEVTENFVLQHAGEFKPEEARMILSGYHKMHANLPNLETSLEGACQTIQ